MGKWKVDKKAIYSCDNGMLLCGKHLGITAECSGRDISGQKIFKMSPQQVAEFAEECDLELDAVCETCGRGRRGY